MQSTDESKRDGHCGCVICTMGGLCANEAAKLRARVERLEGLPNTRLANIQKAVATCDGCENDVAQFCLDCHNSLRATIAAKDEEIKRLATERELLKGASNSFADGAMDQQRRAEAAEAKNEKLRREVRNNQKRNARHRKRLRAAEAENVRLREALKPFARIGHSSDGMTTVQYAWCAAAPVTSFSDATLAAGEVLAFEIDALNSADDIVLFLKVQRTL